MPEKPKRPWQNEWRLLRTPQHVHRFGIVTKVEGAIFARAPPKTLFSEGDVEIAELHPHIHLQRIESVRGSDCAGPLRNCIQVAQQVLHRPIVWPSAVRLLVLSPKITGKTPPRSKSR